MIYIVAIVAAIAGFLFGYDEGVIAGILDDLQAHFEFGEVMMGVVTSALPLGALFGAMILGSTLVGNLTKKFGRKQLLIFAAGLLLIGAAMAAFATSVSQLIPARIVLGLGIGFSAVITPLYISEIAPSQIRGRLVATYQLAITLGILIAYLADFVLIDYLSWRWLIAIAMLPAVIMIVGLVLLPESPRWLSFRKKPKAAYAALTKLRKYRTKLQVDQEFVEINQIVAEEKGHTKWSELFSRQNRAVLILAMGLFVLQQLSGINIVIYYAPKIFAQLGFESFETQILATVGIGLVNFLMTIVAMWLVESWGRRRLLLIGFSGTAVSLLAISLLGYFAIPELAWLSVVAVAVYIMAFAVSLGPIPYIIMSEVFPLNVRGSGMGMASICNWGFNFLVVLMFPIMLAMLGIMLTFVIFALFCVLGLVFTYYWLPETQGISLEQIEHHIHSGKPFRQLKRYE